MIRRPHRLAEIERVLARSPVCALLGPRQWTGEGGEAIAAWPGPFPVK